MNILMLSIFPFADPRQGGQHRAYHLERLLREAGHSVCAAGISSAKSLPRTPLFLPRPSRRAIACVTGGLPSIGDWAVGEMAASDDTVFAALADKIPFRPDVILCVQPWLFRFAERYRAECCGTHCPIAYDSHNVEHGLRAETIARETGDIALAEQASNIIRACEINAISRAGIVGCVSEADRQWSIPFGSSSPILAPNGVGERHADAKAIRTVEKITRKQPFALYCASGHPPNIDGFFEMLAASGDSFPADTKLVVVGGAGKIIRRDWRFSRLPWLRHRYIDAGHVSEGLLCGFLERAHMILLPITYGGGTNLKTAEALWSEQYVVATPTALRGFEQYSQTPGLTIAEDAHAFSAAISDRFSRPSKERQATSHVLMRDLLWDDTLASFVQGIVRLKETTA